MSSETVVSSVKTTTTTTTTVTEEKVVQVDRPVRWAPIRGIPIKRRLQMMAVCIWISLVLLCISTFTIMATYRFLWPVVIAYVTFLYVDKAPESGGRRFESSRHWTIWKYFAAYFPVTLIKVNNMIFIFNQ